MCVPHRWSFITHSRGKNAPLRLYMRCWGVMVAATFAPQESTNSTPSAVVMCSITTLSEGFACTRGCVCGCACCVRVRGKKRQGGAGESTKANLIDISLLLP